jgi:alkylated DNA repair protein (DNA oxidative demethylase)
VLLRGAALRFEKEILAALNEITTVSPFRHMVTPGGFTMSVAMTNCGAVGWVTDRTGYRYDHIDPETANAWPPMPGRFLDLATAAAEEADYPEFRPDACLIIRYCPVRVCRFTRTRTSAISPIRLCPCRWVCRRRSSSTA